MNRFLHILLNCCTATLILGIPLANSRAAGESAPALKITATLAAKSPILASASFRIVLRVENVSGKPQFVQAMSCSWPEDWKTDHSRMFVGGWDCAKNVRQTIEIVPGGFFTDELDVSSDGQARDAVTFSMGFDPENGGKRVWSNELKVQIDPTAKTTPGPAGWNGMGSRTWGPGCKVVRAR